MTENREAQQAGSPVQEAEASETEVLAAVERAKDPTAVGDDATIVPEASPIEEPAVDTISQDDPMAQRTTVGLDTEPYVETPRVDLPERLPHVDETPTASPEARTLPASAPSRDGEIRISADHPMAALYMQTPMPPEVRGNRGAGTLIALLATVVFALVYAGVIALRISLDYPPSTFLSEGLLPFVTSWGFIAANVAFLVGLVFLVLIFGRAGWWAYVLGGFAVAVLVWAAAVVGYALDPEVMGVTRTSWSPVDLARDFGLTIPTLGAALVAREVSIWFGAWIGARGRKITAKNSEALAEYEAALAEVRAKQSA